MVSLCQTNAMTAFDRGNNCLYDQQEGARLSLLSFRKALDEIRITANTRNYLFRDLALFPVVVASGNRQFSREFANFASSSTRPKPRARNMSSGPTL
jgi:hypothetical protein